MTKPFNIKYDTETDILNVSFGKAQKAVSIEQEPEVYVRVDPKTRETLGFTVLGFKRYFRTKKSLRILPQSFQF